MPLAVVVVTYNSRATLAATLASVRGAEVVVVDNASLDGTADWVQACWPKVRLVRMGRNAGFSAAINAGVAASAAPDVLLLNPDAALLPGQLAELPPLLQRLQRSLGAWAVGLGQCDARGAMQLAWGPRPTLGNELGRRWVQRALDRPASLRGRTVARALGWALPRPRRVAWVAGSSLLVRRRAFVRVGGFDPGFFLYFEDIDFCLRLARAGGHVAFDPTVRVVHHRGHSMAQAPRLARLAYRDSQKRLAQLHLGGLSAAAVAAWAEHRARTSS